MLSLVGYITHRGLELDRNDIINKYQITGYKKLLKKFVIRYKSPIGTFYIEKKNYTVKDNILILPRFASTDLLNCKIISNIINHIEYGHNIDFVYIGEPTYNQQIVIDYIFNNIYTESNKSKGLCGLTLNAQAGSGKTFLAMNIINRLNLKTLIIVPNTYLLNQWVELLSKFFPNNKIGQYYGKKKEDGDIIVSIINSLVNDEYIFDEVIISDIICDNIKCNNIAKYNFEDESKPIFCTKHKCKNMIKIRNQKVTKNYIEFFKEFGFVILDESHIYCTDSFKIVYNRFQSTYMLGLSATPDERNNKCDIISHLNIGKVLKADEIEGYKKDNTKFNATVTLLRYNGPDEYVNTHINETTKMICVPKIIEDIINDPYRNQLIIDQLIELFNLKLNIFVFSERRSHLEHLYELFNTTIKKNNDNIDIDSNLSIPELNINNNIVLYGNSSDDDIDTAKNNSNIIFTTYAYSSTGISINRMTALILTTPRRSKSVQIIGRIFRLNDINNDEERIIIDLIDNKSVLKNQLYERMKAYKERDCIIQKKEINYNEINL
jgi:superfamily II DNA or RNA helicase